MDGLEPRSTRDSSGRFLPGTSGNPAGKRPGTRNRKTVLAEALRDGEDVTVARVVIDKAIAGDAVAARFLLSLLSPKPRGRAIELDLPKDARTGDIVAAFDATLAAMAAGEITPDEALIVTKVLDARRRAIETLALECRTEAQAKAAGDRRAMPDITDATADSLHSTCISRRPAVPGRSNKSPSSPRRRGSIRPETGAAEPWIPAFAGITMSFGEAPSPMPSMNPL
jgi:hypothetical protein